MAQCPNVFNHFFHVGMYSFGSQILVPKVCEYIKSGHTFGRCTVKDELPCTPAGGNFTNKILPIHVAKAKRVWPSWHSQADTATQLDENEAKFHGSLSSETEFVLKIEKSFWSVEDESPNAWWNKKT
jgi:hypothetical protein